MARIIDSSIESAKVGREVKAPVVSLKVRKNGKPSPTMVRRTEPPRVGNEVVRIINECDPIGFLADIVNGKAIECHIVDPDGKIITIYETPGMNKRIEVAKFLAERYMPKVAVTKHAHLVKNVDEQPRSNDPRGNFEQIVNHAAQSASSSED